MGAITTKKVSVRKPITVSYNNGSAVVKKVFTEQQVNKLLQALITAGGLVSFTAKSWRRTILTYTP